MYYDWKPYVPVAERRRKAERELEKQQKKGHLVSPVVIEGRTIARTFWGKSWCENLERYSDFANRLPRGRTYVRNGSVLDLQITPGCVEAQVMGSELYRVVVKIKPVPKARWSSICQDCAGAIDSLVELLQGRFSKGVMERICLEGTGLFPAPSEIELSCSCPDWATMCKHVAAVLYGIGARLDEQPELLFRLRGVDEKDLLAQAAGRLPLAKPSPAAGKILEGGDLSDIFGLELAGETASEPEAKPKVRKAAKKESISSKPSVEPVKRKAKSGKQSVGKSGTRVEVETRTAMSTGKATTKATAKAGAKASPKAKTKTVPEAKVTAQPKGVARRKPATSPTRPAKSPSKPRGRPKRSGVI